MADVRLAGVLVACLPLASCAVVSSLNSYSKCESACADPDSAASLDIFTVGDASSADDGGPANPFDNAGTDVIAPLDATSPTDSSLDGDSWAADGPRVSDATDAPNAADAADATDASGSCDGSTCPVTVSAATAWSCLKGACNGT